MDIIIRTFSVYFGDTAKFSEDEKHAIAKVTITLEGTHDQIAGYLCLFFAFHGTGSLKECCPPDLNVEFFKKHWHWFSSRERLLSISKSCFAIETIPMQGDVMFLTNKISQFCSGMNMVQDIRCFNANGDTVTWSQANLRDFMYYFDLINDNNRKSYLQNENDGYAGDDIPKIMTNSVDTKQIPPLKTVVVVESLREDRLIELIYHDYT
jgi:hypothetical protein